MTEMIKKLAGKLRTAGAMLENVPGVQTYEDYAKFLIDEGVTVQEWISVKDRLPEEDGNYLIYLKTTYTGYPIKGFFAKNGGDIDENIDGENVWFDYDSEYGFYYLSFVTHWMPLPEPPKGE